MTLAPLRMVSEAALLAAQRHSGMARKGRGKEPYINHLAEVANLVSEASGGADAELVAASWLHDIMENTETTREELAERFSVRVAALVVEVSDDMGLPEAERRRLQVVAAPHKSPAAKLIKIADKISNIRGRVAPEPSKGERADLADYVGWAEQVVSGCRGGNAWLDRTFDETVTKARNSV